MSDVTPVDVRERDLLEFEFDSVTPHTGQYFVGFFKDDGKFAIDLPDYRFRVWPAPERRTTRS